MMETKRNIDEVSDLEIITELFKFFRTERAVQLIGWAVLWGVTNAEEPKKMREKLEQQGLSKSSTYRALADFRRFGEHLETKQNRPLKLVEVIQRLATLHPAQTQFARLG
jgi:hypothetical protein